MKHLTLTLLLLAATIPALAIYMEADLRDVPLKRLIKNVEKQTTSDPNNAQAWHHVARTHAMAYSRKLAESDEVQMYLGQKSGNPLKKKSPPEPWFGFDGPRVPFSQVKKATTEEANAIAKQHLEKAIAAYRKARTLSPDDTTIRLGLAWALDQAGNDDEAIKEYRAILAEAWKREGKMTGGFGNYLYTETGAYLLPHLDSKKDAREIAEIKKRTEHLESLPRAITPIIIPVEKETTSLTNLIDRQARVPFDLDGTGRKLEWQWITPDAAWLVYDPNHTGQITSATQMFGNRSFLLFCETGYEALALLDDDGNGTLTDTELDGLSLWRDIDSDGHSTPQEVRPLSHHGITSLSVKTSQHPTGIAYSPQGATLTDGSTRPTYDIILHSIGEPE